MSRALSAPARCGESDGNVLYPFMKLGLVQRFLEAEPKLEWRDASCIEQLSEARTERILALAEELGAAKSMLTGTHLSLCLANVRGHKYLRVGLQFPR